MLILPQPLFLFLTQAYRRLRTGLVEILKSLIDLFTDSPSAKNRLYRSLYRNYQTLVYFLRLLTLSKLRTTAYTKHLLRLASQNPLHPTLLKAFNLNIPDSPLPNTVYYLLASGQGVRWQGQGLKQLSLIHGRPLIARTLKQVPQGIVVSHHPKLHSYPHAIPTRHAFIIETLLSTQNHWSDRTIILLADVVFDSRDLQTILAYEGDFAVFGSRSQVEIFALSFTKSAHANIRVHLYRALADAYRGGRGKLWDFYHSFVGLPLGSIGFGRHFKNLTRTTDVDTIEDYDRIIKGKAFKSY